MEENTECKHCRTWEDEIYWNHFTSIHFFLTLPSHFHDHLVLPEKFFAHMKDQLPDKVSLKGPNGVLWDIELLKSDDLVFVGNGWNGFVKANGLKESCLLVFKYERNSSFEVLIFDQGNCCEIESTYFVKYCRHNIKSNQEDQTKRVVRDGGEEEAYCVASKKRRRDDGAEVCSEEKENASTPKKAKIVNEKDKAVSHMSQRDMIALENGESYFKGDESHKSEAQSKKSLHENDEAEACSRKEMNALGPKKGAISAALNHGGRPRTRLALSVARQRSIMNKKAKEVSDTPPRGVIIVNGESSSEEDDYYISRAQSKNFPSRLKVSQLLYYSRRTKGQAAGKQKSHDTKDGGWPNKQVLPKSPKKRVFKSASEGKRSYKKLMSNRRNVTETEKENTLQRATQNQTEDSFTVVLRPSNLYPRYFMHIPAKWLRKHPLQGYQEVLLRVGAKTWHTTYLSYVHSQGLQTGWNKFAKDNLLEEFDVLVFKPVSMKEAVAVLDVDIFKVV